MTRLRAASLALTAVALGAVAFLASGCGSLDKPALERALLDLPKNADLRARGLQTIALEVPRTSTPGDPYRAEGVFVRIPAAAPAGRAPLALVHGTPASLFNWTALLETEAMAPILAERDVYLLDVLGHGVTRDPGLDGPVTFQRCADYLGAFLRALELTDVCLVGNSYGGEFVWRAALDHPDVISRVVLLDAAGYARSDEEFLPEEVAMRENPLAPVGWRLNSRDRILTALQPHFGATVGADQLEEMYLLCANAENWHAMVDLARDENGTRADELTRLAQPTLLIWGDRDLAYPADVVAERFRADIPDATLHVLGDCGHYPHEERPAKVAARLRDFLAQPIGDR